MNNCKSCTAELTGNYCINCGQPAKLKRIDRHYIIHEIEHVLHFDKGILFTTKELLIRPGESVREYLSENRSRLVKPIIFVILTSLIYSLVNHFFHIEQGYVSYQQEALKDSAIFKMLDWIQSHYGYANILMGVFIAGWIKLFFRKYQYNFFEILILLCFAMGISMLICAIAAIFEGLLQVHLMQYAGMLMVVYSAWAIGQFFDKTKAINYFKAVMAYLIGILSFYILLSILGIVIDLALKKI
ncbi:DUF3667 domain-containing protein [Flavobacterium cerinum]|uniref:DUF3667 domain-containing protein n=1 Tax=Flavobacterium cerinum TaxID=2502784 RepID=A0ABY5IQK9_9FLAO|nr:DUF3667 domain-containing protein [Flavobacterium cerinum]UUC44073.1 DUF3667 domain-containing protein [Flavobacterium cerinum]